MCRFYVGCDRCQGWFHGSCVGITQTEADNIDSYICPKCKNTADNQDQRPLTEKDYESLKRIVRSLQVRFEQANYQELGVFNGDHKFKGLFKRSHHCWSNIIQHC